MSDTIEILGRMLQEVIGEDWALEDPISAQTSFNDDLELESIEFVALAEKLQEHYGESIDFVAWLSSKELDEIITLRVGEVAEFIDTSCGSG